MSSEPSVSEFYTTTGQLVRVRPLLPDDAPYLIDIFENMSVDSRYRRFLQSLEKPSMEVVWSEAEQIAHAVAKNSRGLIAFADLPDHPDSPVGAARYVLVNDREGELAISVRDDMQRQGIGLRLSQLLVAEARKNGVERLTGVFQSDNEAVRKLVKHLDVRVTQTAEGAYVALQLHLAQQDDPQPALS